MICNYHIAICYAKALCLNAKPHLRDLAARGAPTEDRGKLLDEGITSLGLVVRKN